jgi:hypothetical protein
VARRLDYDLAASQPTRMFHRCVPASRSWWRARIWADVAAIRRHKIVRDGYLTEAERERLAWLSAVGACTPCAWPPRGSGERPHRRAERPSDAVQRLSRRLTPNVQVPDPTSLRSRGASAHL